MWFGFGFWFFLKLDLPVEDVLWQNLSLSGGEIFSFGTVSITSKLLLDHVSDLAEKLM